MKKVCSVIVMCMLMSFSVYAEDISGTTYEKNIVLTIDDKKALVNEEVHELVTPPTSRDGRTLLPLRFVVEEVIEGQVEWNQDTREIKVLKDNKEIIMTLDKKEVIIDGISSQMDVAPTVINNVTLLPIRFISEQFEVQVTYEAKTKQVLLQGGEMIVNTPPIAQFSFSKDEYISGEEIYKTNLSYDLEDDKIIAGLWSVVGENEVVANELEDVFKTPTPGEYSIGLKVKDEHGLWSDWTYQKVIIKPNAAPVITNITTTKSTYARGEHIEYNYNYNDEPWDEVSKERWSYRKEGEDKSRAILGKPEALFTAGNYIVNLQIDDSVGNRSEEVEVKVEVTDEIMKEEFEYAFTEGNIGDIIDNYQGFNFRDYEDITELNKTTIPGTMIMSDSPEVVTREGILYRDDIDGTGRILVHHINDFSEEATMSGRKRFVMVAENKTSMPVSATFTNKTIKGPVSDVLLLGQRMLNEYLVGVPSETITLMPGEKVYIYDSEKKWLKGTCISGLMDVATTGPMTFTMAAVSAGNTINNMDSMELFIKTTHPRGTFDTVGINYNIELDGSIPEKILLGAGDDEWLVGHDALTGDVAVNKGNFGVSYYITITAKEDTGIILNPRATIFRGAIQYEGGEVYNIPSMGSIYSNTAKAVSLGVIKAGETKTIEYMLPNGSASPILLGFIPKEHWRD